MKKDTTTKPRLRMSQRAFLAWWIPPLVLLTALTLIINVAAGIFAPMLDSFLGSGGTSVSRRAGSENWDADYYKKQYGSLEEAAQHSTRIAQQVSEEGIVLLKNNGTLPLAQKTAVTPYGYAYLNPAYSGTGAAATANTDNVTPEQGLNAQFSVQTELMQTVAKTTASFPDAAKGTPALNFDTNSLQAMTDGGKSAQITEYGKTAYEQAAASAEKESAAVVFITRNGSEGVDKRIYAYADGTPHYLALTQAEKDMIAVAKAHHSSVTVVLNTANPVEVSPLMSGELEVDAIVWMGTAGSRGFAALGRVLSGAVNPSGRLTDIYATDFTKDPTSANFGQYGYSNVTYTDTTLVGRGKQMPWPFVEYEEGIYVGYKYYETAAAEDANFVYGAVGERGERVQDGAVAYPFGYGLSYTSFEQKLESVDRSSEGERVDVRVTVTNTGSRAGKDVVQIYAASPYTDYDRARGVEKAATQLVDFTKTKQLEPGESQMVTLSFTDADVASYDRTHENADGAKGAYLLEAGDYAIQLKKNSHDVLGTQMVHMDVTRWMEDSSKGPSGSATHAAHNEFDDLSSYMDAQTIQLTRDRWAQTQPTMPENREAVAPEAVKTALELWKNFDVQKNPEIGNVSGSKVYADTQPVSGQKNGLSLIDLRGASPDDPRWEKLMDQLDFVKDKDAIQKLLYMAAYQTAFIPSIGKPVTVDKDGAMGWSTVGSSSWPSVNVMASTFDAQLMHDVGEAFGEEALQQGLSGWYAPAVNIHRSPFGGRVYEYYAEDGVLSGKLAAATISGAGDKGVISYLKHFAINDQETNRSNYMATWVNEQATREIYLKPFQIAVTAARSELPYLTDSGEMKTKQVPSATAIMSAQNNIGTVIGFGHYGLQTNVLRGEWGFGGAVVTDMFLETQNGQRDLTMRAGSDMYMIQIPGNAATDYDSPTARAAMRRAVQHVAYMTVNSNAMNGVTPGATVSPGISGWQKVLWGVDAGVVVIVALMVTWMVRRGRLNKRYPELFNQKKMKE